MLRIPREKAQLRVQIPVAGMGRAPLARPTTCEMPRHHTKSVAPMGARMLGVEKSRYRAPKFFILVASTRSRGTEGHPSQLFHGAASLLKPCSLADPARQARPPGTSLSPHLKPSAARPPCRLSFHALRRLKLGKHPPQSVQREALAVTFTLLR